MGALVPAAHAASPRLDFIAPGGTPKQTVLDAGGLKLKAACHAGPQLVVNATTRVADAMIHADSQPGFPSGEGNFAGTADFSPGDVVHLIAADGPLGVGTTPETGQIIYARPNGNTVTVDFTAAQGAASLDTTGCTFAGTATALRPSTDLIGYTSDEGEQGKLIFRAGGLSLRGRCMNGGVPSVIARTESDNATIHLNEQGSNVPSDAYAEADDFDRATKLNLFSALGADPDSTAGQIIYSQKHGAIVTVDWMAEENAFAGSPATAKDCAFLGTATVADASSPHWIRFSANAPTSDTQLFKDSKVVLRASCAAGPVLDAQFAAQDPDRVIGSYNEQFDPGDASSLGSATGDALTVGLASSSGADNTSGQILVSRANGTNVTFDWMAEEGEAYGGSTDCLLAGTVDVSSP